MAYFLNSWKNPRRTPLELFTLAGFLIGKLSNALCDQVRSNYGQNEEKDKQEGS